MPSDKRSRILEFALIFAIAYLLSQALTTFVFPKRGEQPRGLTVSMQDATVRRGHAPVVAIQNDTAHELLVSSDITCPMPPFNVFRVGGGSGELTKLTTDDGTIVCDETVHILGGDSGTFSLAPWKYTLFAEAGEYEIRLPMSPASTALFSSSGGTLTLSTRFTLNEASAPVRLFRGLIIKPLLFVLVAIAGALPGHSLGLAIILLTVLVKLLLFIPTQHALEGQRKMQALQPKLEALKKTHGGDGKKLHEETLKLWREHKVNPFQSCLPMLLQFPVLIGLFYVIRDGGDLSIAREYLYPTHEHLSWTFDHHFLGLDLTKPSWYLFPPLLVGLQFVQMWLSFHIAKRKGQKEGKPQPVSAATETQQKVMLYVLPLMIGFFAFQFPSAVSLYWAVSTLFAIGQQVVVNRKVVV
ncbi:MAG: preprotein translocase subunit YidC [Candidatus Peregrinibacteria bacterium Gr01-1014_25]|nr:MAG: preprotein translocase subunit YidC [Candidatus Peregrinibacteria bacterium Gr01-1014_25]